MNEIDKLLRELQNLKEEIKTFNPNEVWDGIAQRKSFSEMGFASKEEFEKWINDNPYANL